MGFSSIAAVKSLIASLSLLSLSWNLIESAYISDPPVVVGQRVLPVYFDRFRVFDHRMLVKPHFIEHKSAIKLRFEILFVDLKRF